MHSVDDIALNMSLRKSKRNTVKQHLLYHILIENALIRID